MELLGTSRSRVPASGRVQTYPSVCCTATQFDRQIGGREIEAAPGSHRP